MTTLIFSTVKIPKLYSLRSLIYIYHSTCFPGFAGLLFILSKKKQQKRQEKVLLIAGKLRQSFNKEEKHITPYSGKYSFLIKV